MIVRGVNYDVGMYLHLLAWLACFCVTRAHVLVSTCARVTQTCTYTRKCTQPYGN